MPGWIQRRGLKIESTKGGPLQGRWWGGGSGSIPPNVLKLRSSEMGFMAFQGQIFILKLRFDQIPQTPTRFVPAMTHSNQCVTDQHRLCPPDDISIFAVNKVSLQGLRENLNSRLPFGKDILKFCLPRVSLQ